MNRAFIRQVDVGLGATLLLLAFTLVTGTSLLLLGLVAIALRRNEIQRHKTELELREREQQFAATFSQAAVGIAHIAPDGSWRQVNHKLCQIVGYTREELLQRTFQDITHPDDLDKDLTYVWQMLAGEIQTYSMEKRYFRKDGSIVWINLTVSLVRDFHGHPKYFISVIEDINDRKIAQLNEQFLIALDRRLRRLSDVSAVVWEVVSSIGEYLGVERCVWYDVNLQEDVAIARQEWRQRPEIPTVVGLYRLSEFVLPAWIAEYQAGQPMVVSDVTTAPHTAPFARNFEERDIRAFVGIPCIDGGSWVAVLAVSARTPQFWLPDRVSLLQEAVARFWPAIAQTRAVLALKDSEERLQQLNSTLEQRVAERTVRLEETNQELEAFSYSVSHDLRAPLRVLQGFSQALQEDYGTQLDEIAQSYIENIVESAVEMDGLINDLLTYSRLSRTQIALHSTDLNQTVEIALKQLQPQIAERQAIVTIAPNLPNVIAHRSILVQVVANLIGNAIKFVDSSTQPRVFVTAEVNRNQVRLWAIDNGIGVAPEHQRRIFRVFERLHGIETYPGTGIGLAIVQKGIERMGGQVGVESEPGSGSRFWFTLPLASPNST